MVIALSFIGLLAGCGPGQVRQAPGSLLLSQAVEVADGRTRRFIQGGLLVDRIDEFRPHCALEIRALHGPPRRVPAGKYPVTRIEPVVTEVVLAAPAVQLAELGMQWRGGGFHRTGDDLPAEIFEGYHYWLQDVSGVGLLRLTCFGARALPVDAHPPSRAELAQVLGSVGRLMGFKER